MSGDTALTLGGGIVGAVAGFAVGGPLGAQVGFALGSGLTASLVADDIVTEGPRLDDLVPRPSAYGTPIPIPYGTIVVPGHIDWFENNQLREVITEEEVGGKGGPSQSVETASYFATFGATLCEGPIAGVRRIWLDTILVYDAGTAATAAAVLGGPRASVAESGTGLASTSAGGDLGTLTIYLGNEQQLPHAREEADRGDGTVPAYRGRARLVWEDLPLERWGNRLPAIRAEVVREGAVSYLLSQITEPQPPSGANLWVDYAEGIITLAEPAEPGLTDVTLRKIGLDGEELEREVVLGAPFIDTNSGILGPVRRLPGVYVGRATIDGQAGSRWGGVLGGWSGILKDVAGAQIAGFHAVAYYSADVIYLLTGGVQNHGNTVYAFNAPGGAPLTQATAQWTSSVGNIRDIHVDVARVWVYTDGGVNLAALHLLEAGTLVFQKQWLGLPSAPKGVAVPDAFGDVAILASQTSQTYHIVRLHDDGSHTELKTGAVAGSTQSIPPIPLAGGLLVRQRQQYLHHGLVGVAGTPVPDVIEDLATRAGLSLTDTDVSAATGDVRGYAVTRPMRARAALSPLRTVHRLDFPEIDYTLRGVHRGGASVATLGADDLGAHEPGQDVPPLLPEQHPDRADLPQRVQVEYLDPATDYEEARQYASRASRPEGRESRVPLTLALTADEAAQAADVVLREAWSAARLWPVAVTLRQAALMPADPVTLTADGVTATARIQRVDDGRPGIRRLQLVADGPTTYQSSATGQAGEASPNAVALRGPTRLALMQLPALRDQDAAAGHYAAAGALLAGWQGAALYRSTDAGESYLRLTGWATSALLGTAVTALPAPESGAGVWDRGSVLHVRIPDAQGAPVSVTEAAILADATAGLWAVAAGDDWELIQVANWAQQVDGTWHGTTLLRGRYATEHAMTGHAESDQVVRLTTAGGVVRVTSNLADVGRQVLMRAVTFGSSIERAADKSLTPRAEALRPWAPAHLRAPTTPGGDLEVSWVRRARLGALGKLAGPVALVETTESYRLEVSRGGTVLRTETLGSPSFTYTAAQQSADGVSTGETLDIDVTQIGDAVDGRPARVSVTAP